MTQLKSERPGQRSGPISHYHLGVLGSNLVLSQQLMLKCSSWIRDLKTRVARDVGLSKIESSFAQF